MRILLTGSSGQLGTEIARQLSAEHQVIGLDLLPGPWTTPSGTVTNRDLIFSLAREADAIIHTASLHARHLLAGASKEADTPALWHDAPSVLKQRAPGIEPFYAARGWALPRQIDRVYATTRAEERLGYQPRYNFGEYLQALSATDPQ